MSLNEYIFDMEFEPERSRDGVSGMKLIQIEKMVQTISEFFDNNDNRRAVLTIEPKKQHNVDGLSRKLFTKLIAEDGICCARLEATDEEKFAFDETKGQRFWTFVGKNQHLVEKAKSLKKLSRGSDATFSTSNSSKRARKVKKVEEDGDGEDDGDEEEDEEEEERERKRGRGVKVKVNVDAYEMVVQHIRSKLPELAADNCLTFGPHSDFALTTHELGKLGTFCSTPNLTLHCADITADLQHALYLPNLPNSHPQTNNSYIPNY